MFCKGLYGKFYVTVLLLVMTLAGIGFSAQTHDSEFADLTGIGQGNLPRVLIIGDSISIGYTEDVAKMLEGKAKVTRPKNKEGKVINCGPTESGIKNIDQWLGDTEWDVIHFNWGLHDLCYRHEDSKVQGRRDKINGKITAKPDEYEANLRKIVARLKSTGATLIWASTTPVPDGEAGRFRGDEIKYNAIAASVMTENGIAVNDLYRYMMPKAKEYWRAPGDVHYTKAGSEYLAGKVAATIECALEPVTLELWPGGAPGAKGKEAEDKPTITVYLPMGGNATGIAVLVCPGGGYGHLAMDHEGQQIARWLNSFGAASIVLNYRHSGKGYGYPAPLDDAHRAMRLVRSNAELWGIDADKIGVIGFSAGGHLASTVTTLYDRGYGKAGDDLDKFRSRPDFSLLCYPVISTTEWFTHNGSKNNLLGKDADDKLVRLMSTELQVTEDTPPTFLLHANDDKVVPPENSIAFYTALRKAKVKTEMHIYEKGGHGFGLGKGKGTTENWPDACRRWILSVASGAKNIQ